MPALRRTIKKTTYAIIFGLIIALPILFIIVPRLRNRPDNTGPVGTIPVSVEIEEVNTVIRSDSADIVARIRNPNPSAGIPEFTITFVLLDSTGNEIQRLTETTYLLPGSLNYIAALDVPLSGDLATVTVEVPTNPNFVAVGDSSSLPTFNSFLRDRSTRSVGPGTVEVQKGVVTNTSTLGFRRVDVTAVAFDSGGNIVGIGKTFIGQFIVGQQREFTLEWPTPATPVQRVIILPSTNIYRTDNILRAVGDPGQLR